MKGEEEKFKSWHERYLKSILERLQRGGDEVAAMCMRHWERWKWEIYIQICLLFLIVHTHSHTLKSTACHNIYGSYFIFWVC